MGATFHFIEHGAAQRVNTTEGVNRVVSERDFSDVRGVILG